MPADTAAEPKIKTSMAGLELPWDLAAFGEERLGRLDVEDLRSECARRGLDVKPRAQKNTCIKLLLEWKAAQGGPKQGLPFDLAHYGKERLEKLDVAVLRTECGLRGIDVKALAQKSTCVAELLKWKAARGGAPAPAKRKPKAESSGPKKKKAKQETPRHPTAETQSRHEAAIFGPNPGPRLFALKWYCEIFAGEFNRREPGLTQLRLHNLIGRFDYKGLATDDELQNLDSDVFADRSISIGRFVMKDSCPQLRPSPEAAVAAAKRLIRALIKRDHEVFGFEDKAEVDNIKDGGYAHGARGFFGVENEITQGPGARGQMAATHYCNVNWKRTWREEEGKECHASITVSIDIMRVIPEVFRVE